MLHVYHTCIFKKPSNHNDAPRVSMDFLLLHLKINYKTTAPHFEIFLIGFII